jgi:hypothetical protein
MTNIEVVLAIVLEFDFKALTFVTKENNILSFGLGFAIVKVLK